MNGTTRDVGGHRPEVQSLRGIAVLAVVLYHLGASLVPSGFLGVDVFFVISGYLVTGTLVRDERAGGISLPGFYARRIRRLVPAASAVVLVVALSGALLLEPAERSSLARQLAGTATFIANVVLWTQGDYFDVEQSERPMLHAWSLSLEEQFYLLLPLALLWLRGRHRRTGIALACAGSLMLCLARGDRDSTFFLLPGRAWELGVGALVALFPVARRTGTIARLAGSVVPLLLVVTFALPAPRVHPGPMALAVVVATALLLWLGRDGGPAVAPGPRILRWFGDRSYSLYLIHWPLIVLVGAVWIGRGVVGPPWWLRAALFLVATSFAALLYRFVETPWRTGSRVSDRATIAAFVGVTVMLLAVSAALPRIGVRGGEAGNDRRPNVGLSAACRQEGPYRALAECTTSSDPGVIVWGDSYAMHLVPGLAAQGSPGLEQATKSTCGPLPGIAPLEASRASARQWARDCIAFNDAVLEHILTNARLQTVVLSSAWWRYLEPGERVLMRRADGAERVAEADAEAAREAVLSLARVLREAGRRVVIVSPPAQAEWDVARCHERLELGLPVLPPAPGCDIPVRPAGRFKPSVLRFLSDVGAAVPVVDIAMPLCDATACRTTLHGVRLYRDGVHLSVDGSITLAAELDLLERIRRDAR